MMTKVISSIRTGLRSVQGFTLIEVLVVCLTAGILGGAMLGLYEGLIRSWADTGYRIVNQDDARTALNEITRYLRMAESSASNLTSTSDAVALAKPQELVFYADIDGNGLPKKVRYYLSGRTLRMATLAPDTSTSPPTYPTAYSSDGVVIMDGIQNGATPMFTYLKMDPLYDPAHPDPRYDDLQQIAPQPDGSIATADLKSILAVDIKLYVNDAPGANGNVALDTRVQIRQRYDGGLSGS